MSVISQALTDVRILMDSSHLLPHHEHFWPDAPVVGRRLPLTPSGMGPGKLSTGQSKEDNCLLLFEPKVKPMISGVEFEAYEYLIKGLFVMKASSIKKALKHMLPGAVSILDAMKRGHPAMTSIGQVDVDPEELVCNLTVTQLVALAKMFERWPFRPQHLFSVSIISDRFCGTSTNKSCLSCRKDEWRSSDCKHRISSSMYKYSISLYILVFILQDLTTIDSLMT